MSTTAETRPVTPPAIQARKGGEPIVCLTSYTAQMAALVDPHVDLILVGDSLAMTIYGMPSTVGVTLEMMIAHGRAVARAARRACIVVDLPFGSYEASPAQAFQAAARVMAETGCAAVKLEGGAPMAETIHFLTRRGVPVMAHVGLTPQSVNALGGYAVRGRAEAEAAAIMADAEAVADAGAFSVVVEKVAEPLARAISGRIAPPTIGIGASVGCDGQILVVDDLIGLFTAFRPKFVRRYAEVAGTIEDAVRGYATDVRARRFPGAEHVFSGG
ncbi:MAG: 3-methyl-2-oxobutanoate hydroxymethyltransferase [Rhodospirillales bacterium 69-11]|nr:3-methyl-2-oxobutanoate hydroxymethyltransferase [Rhodospirillales bacterium]OJW24907.1 MAG: 3-methyl-2-oxobutanoate hydroxymethyltransferase [Rhodospirillales bacterium 69-11]